MATILKAAENEQVTDQNLALRSGFHEVIMRLEKRAKSARRKAFIVSVVVAVLSCFAISVMIAGLLFRDQVLVSGLGPTISESTSIRGTGKLDTPNIILSEGAEAEIMQESTTGKSEIIYFSELLFQTLQETNASPEEIEAYTKAFLPEIAKARDTVSPIIISGIFSAGTIGMTILLIQISMNFVRYFSRLSEMYDAQADALRASAGKHELLVDLMRDFSPSGVDFGKAPVSIYEKAIEAVAEIGKGARGKS